MKRWLQGALCAVLLVLSAVTAFAQHVCYVPEGPLSLELPEDWAVFLTDFDKNDPNLERFGYTSDEMRQILSENDLALDAYAPDGQAEILLYIYEDEESYEYYDFGDVEDPELEELAQGLIESSASSDIVYTRYVLYPHDETKFIFFEFTRYGPEEIVPATELYTVYNGRHVALVFQRYDTPLTREDGELMREVVESLQLGVSEPWAPQPNRIPESEYRGETNTGFYNFIFFGVMFMPIFIIILVIVIVSIVKSKGRTQRGTPGAYRSGSSGGYNNTQSGAQQYRAAQQAVRSTRPARNQAPGQPQPAYRQATTATVQRAADPLCEHEQHSQRAQLKSLLEAGIIERDEYEEKLRQLK